MISLNYLISLAVLKKGALCEHSLSGRSSVGMMNSKRRRLMAEEGVGSYLDAVAGFAVLNIITALQVCNCLPSKLLLD